MPRRLPILVLLFSFVAPALFAKDIYIAVGGAIGVFRSDARIFNPSSTKDITVEARFLPAGGDTTHPNNSGVAPLTITIGKRQMVAYDDMVSSLFHTSGLGSIRLTSSDDFVATQRVYAGLSNTSGATPCANGVNPCTLGQFVPGIDVSTAKKKGVLIQLKSNGNFRTNFGFVNPNGTAATVTVRLYDKSNALAGAVKTITMQPFGVMTPTNIAAYFGSPANDLSDAWASYDSDQPVFGYASVVDNGSTDQTFIAGAEDTDVPVTPPPPSAKTFNVTLRSWAIDISPPLEVNRNDVVTLKVAAIDSGHGFTLVGPNGNTLVADRSTPYPVGTTFTYTFTANQAGTYGYFCTRTTCGSGHTDMSGIFSVGEESDPTRY